MGPFLDVLLVGIGSYHSSLKVLKRRIMAVLIQTWNFAISNLGPKSFCKNRMISEFTDREGNFYR
jgi:hypothetical protein